VQAAWQLPDAAALAWLHEALPPEDLGATMAATRQALARREQKPLQVVLLRLPVGADGAAAEQAFQGFKRCVSHLTGLARYGVTLDYHGREFGGQGWFDQVGLFLDMVPFAAAADTPLADLAGKAEALQKRGINFFGLSDLPGSAWHGTLPPLDHGAMFNFITQVSRVPTEAHLRHRLHDYHGILFEAAAADGELRGHCSFRGDEHEAEALRRLLAGEEPAPPPGPGPGRVPARAPALEVRDVHKRYGEFVAVRGVSFAVRRGGCFGILGPNGAGKTSLLAMIEGLVPITSGSIRLLGMDVGSELHRIQPHVGVQLQQNNYFKFLTVAQLLKFYQALRGAVGGPRRGRPVEVLLERLDLKDKLGFKVDQLSGGQKQRLSIAIALLEDPDVVFLDEPTSALDPHSRIATWEFIEELKQEAGKTVILTTHYMEEAERLCDEILLMDRGRVIAQGSPAELARQLAPRHSIRFQFGRGQFRPELLHGLAEAADMVWDARADSLCLHTTQVSDTLPAVLARTQAAGVAVVHIDIHRPTLEDVFLLHTGQPPSTRRMQERPTPGSTPHIQGALL
jgi:ABC-type multidrug transport system ATPase subunit